MSDLESPATASRPPPMVLFVHDGEPYEAHVELLRQAGYRVAEAHAGEALGLAHSLQPDMIVLDFGCNGDVTRTLKSNPATQQIPIIALVELLKSLE